MHRLSGGSFESDLLAQVVNIRCTKVQDIMDSIETAMTETDHQIEQHAKDVTAHENLLVTRFTPKTIQLQFHLKIIPLFLFFTCRMMGS